MISSMISKMIKSMITTIINPFDGAGLLSRYFVNLDPVLNSHYDMVKPITFTGDFEIESDIECNSFSGHMIASTSGIAQDYFFVRSGTGEIGLNISGVSLNGTIVVADGKLHTIKITKVGTTLSLFVDGVADGTATTTSTVAEFELIGKWYNLSLQFDGIIANVKFTDQSGASDVVTTFELDNSPSVTNYVYSENILNNVFTDDRNAKQYLVASKGWIITDGGAAP